MMQDDDDDFDDDEVDDDGDYLGFRILFSICNI